MLMGIKNKWLNHKYKDYTFEQALAVISKDGEHLQYLSDLFKDHLDVVSLAIIQNSTNIVHASPRIKNTREHLIQLIKITPWILTYLNKTLDTDKEMALIAVSTDSSFIEQLPTSLKNDIDIGYAVIKKHGLYLSYLGTDLKKNRIFVLDAMRYLGVPDDADLSLQNDASIKFVCDYTNVLSDVQWPIIRKALIEKPFEFLNPPQILSDLLEDNPDKFLLLAQRALTGNLDTASSTNELAGIELI